MFHVFQLIANYTIWCYFLTLLKQFKHGNKDYVVFSLFKTKEKVTKKSMKELIFYNKIYCMINVLGNQSFVNNVLNTVDLIIDIKFLSFEMHFKWVDYVRILLYENYISRIYFYILFFIFKVDKAFMFYNPVSVYYFDKL